MKELNFIYDLSNVRDLAPEILKNSEKYKNILIVIDGLIAKHIVSNIELLEYFERIDSMSEKEIDLLARELSVDFYDFSMSVEEKRKACKLSFQIHSIKGTNKAVQDTLSIFYKDANILEFPKYNGVAGTFKIEINGNAKNDLQIMIDRVEKVKKKSQHLKGLIFKNNSDITLKPTLHLKTGTKVILYPAQNYYYLNGINMKNKFGNFVFEEIRRK